MPALEQTLQKFLMIDIQQNGLISAILIAFGYYFKKYLDKKVEGLAQKSDLKNVTQIVEDVKSEYSKALTLLTANLTLASKGIESFEAEAFKAYVSFHTECSYLVNDLTNFGFSIFRNIKLLDQYSKLAEDVQKRLGIAKASIDLFNDQNEISVSVEKLFKASIIYVSTISNGLGTIAYFSKEIEKYSSLYGEALNSIDNPALKEEESATARETADEYYKIREQYKTDIQNAQRDIENYVAGEEFQQVKDAMTEYEALIRKYIKDQRLKLLNQAI